MKFPKLKHTVLCQILLYLPAFSFFICLAVLAFIPGAEDNTLSYGFLIFTAVFSGWYLFRNFSSLLWSDILFFSIRQWKADRAEYRTLCNGNDLQQIRSTVLRRCERWGKRFQPHSGNTADVELFYRHGHTVTVFWSLVEMRVAVCTSDTLSAKEYHRLTHQARILLSAAPKGKPRFKTKGERNAPCAQANVIIILADTVDDEVKELARKPLMKTDELCVLPCVIGCTDGTYYVNCIKDYYEQGMTPRPAVNFAAYMIRKLVFSRRLPKENEATQPESDLDYDIETSLWAYLKKLRGEFREVDDEMNKDRVKAYHRMQNGEVRIGEAVIWYKRDNRLAEYAILPDEEDETLISLLSDNEWYYKRDEGHPLSGLFRKKLSRKKMKKGEQEQVEKYMRSKLIAEGYRISEE